MKKDNTAELQADAVLNFLTLGECVNASTPDFVTDAVIDAITEAGARVGCPTPTYAPEESEADRRKILVDLFSKTEMLSLRNDEPAKPTTNRSDWSKVIEAVHELLHNPNTPTGLFNKVAEFVCEQENIVGDEFFHSPAVLAAVFATVEPDDLMGAVIARRGQEANSAN